MSLPTPGTIVRHELCGLHVAVADAPNPDLVGIAGRVVDETAGTLRIEADAGETAGTLRVEADAGEQSRVWQVPKAGTTFEFALTDEAAAGPGPRPGRRRASRDGDGNSAGTASEPRSETTGSERSPAGRSDPGDGVAHVTVDGARLLSRPARRTETGGVSKWR